MDTLALLLLPAPLRRLHSEYLTTKGAAECACDAYTLAERRATRARRQARARQIPPAALRRYEAAEAAAWDAWAAADSAASRAWWAWEHAFSTLSRQHAAGYGAYESSVAEGGPLHTEAVA